MKKIIEMINQAVEVLVANKMEKTGYKTQFTGYRHLNVEEIEMMEFLFQFDGAMEKLVKLVEENKGDDVYTPILKLMYHLNKIHNFGFLNRSKVEVLDTIEDITQITMKPRHVTYLRILKDIRHDIETLFVNYYNQTPSHLNPFRVEQALFAIKETLESEGIKTDYRDFKVAVPHTFTGDWVPYFCKSNWGYYIVDSFGGFDGSLSIIQWPGEKPQWSYVSSKYANRWHSSKSTAEVQITKLRELNAIAGIEGLDWEIKFENRNDLEFKQGEYNHVYQDIPKWKVTLYKKMEREILRGQKLSKRSA